MNFIDIAIAKGYTEESLMGAGALKGDKGETGDSAYIIAVNNGFEGTEEEWLESLKVDESTVKNIVDKVVEDSVNEISENISQLSSEIDKLPEFGTTNFMDGFAIADADGDVGMHIGSKDIWKYLPYNRKYGFGGYPYGNGELPPFSRVAGIWESDMLSVRGGKGRWNGEDTTNFKHGGHVFEGWNKEEDVRLTAGIGLNNKDIAWIQTFHPANEEGTDGGAYYGITKIGSDLDGQGCNFLPTVTLAQSAFVLWNRPTDYIPKINPEQLQLLVDTGEIPNSIVNVSEGLIYGAMYFDTTMQKVRVYTQAGWKNLKFEEE